MGLLMTSSKKKKARDRIGQMVIKKKKNSVVPGEEQAYTLTYIEQGSI